jgi:hypothetical protein
MSVSERATSSRHVTKRLAGPAWRQRALHLLILPVILMLGYAASPYVTLWRLNQALIHNDELRLEALVDLAAIRLEIGRALNKDQPSAIDQVSDSFIVWLEQGLRRHGTAVLDELVTLDWVRAQLTLKTGPRVGFFPAMTWAFFEGPASVRVRLGEPQGHPVLFRLSRVGLRWRVTLLYS